MDVFGEIRGPRFPDLPILNPGDVPVPAAPARGQREKYGGLFYLGIVGLVVLVGLIAWFGYGLWSHRAIWAEVYALNDGRRPLADRLDAALRLSRDPRFGDEARIGLALRKDLPSLARYLLAESVSTELVAHDPRTYALEVARSEGWPDWLRLLLARQLAYGSVRGYAVPTGVVVELCRHPDPMIRLWATFTLAAHRSLGPDSRVGAELEEAARAPTPDGRLALMLLDALRSEGEARERRLDDLTVWLRRHHPQAREIWRGWEIRDQHLEREAAP